MSARTGSIQQTLIVLRHAHRETVRGRKRDNGISKKGRLQSIALKRFFRFRFGKNLDVLLLSSPKKRCLETLGPIAEMVGTDIEVHSALDERRPGESVAAFKKRVQKFCLEWKKSRHPLTVVCAHGDWIPVAAEKLVGLSVHLSKGGWMEFCGGNKTELGWVVQKLTG